MFKNLGNFFSNGNIPVGCFFNRSFDSGNKSERKCVKVDYIERLKAQIEGAQEMETHYREIADVYKKRRIKLKIDLRIVEYNIKKALQWTNFIHFCQTGKYLDEDKPGEWMDFL